MAKSSKEHGRNSNTLLAPKKRKVHENSLANLKRNGHTLRIAQKAQPTKSRPKCDKQSLMRPRMSATKFRFSLMIHVVRWASLRTSN
jgi:hypothetical protein